MLQAATIQEMPRTVPSLAEPWLEVSGVRQCKGKRRWDYKRSIVAIYRGTGEIASTRSSAMALPLGSLVIMSVPW